MKIFLVFLVMLIAISFSLAANTDSFPAKVAQNQCKATLNKLKNKANFQKNKLRIQLTTASNSHVNEMKRTGNTISAALRPLGDQGSALATSFNGNISQIVETFNFISNPMSLSALLEVSLEQLRLDYIDQIQNSINNLTIAINNNSNAYTCFKSNLKSIQAIADNVITQIDPITVQVGASLKGNMSSVDTNIESIRTTAVSALRACRGSQVCGVKYNTENNAMILGNLTQYDSTASTLLLNAIDVVYSNAKTILDTATESYKNQTKIIETCINKL